MITQTDLFSTITDDAPKGPPTVAEVAGPLDPATREPGFDDIRARLQEHAYWCQRGKFPPMDLARDCDFLLQFVANSADPAAIETTGAHWFEKYKAEAAKRGELIYENGRAIAQAREAFERACDLASQNHQLYGRLTAIAAWLKRASERLRERGFVDEAHELESQATWAMQDLAKCEG